MAEAPNVTGNPLKYNSKELERSFGLETYDFGSRTQSSPEGRFWQIDPDAEEYEFMSPYCYAANNPVRYIDVDGRGPGETVAIPRKAPSIRTVSFRRAAVQSEAASSTAHMLGNIFLNELAAANEQEANEKAAFNYVVNVAIEAAPGVVRAVNRTIDKVGEMVQESSAAAALPKLKGKTLPHIGKVLNKKGFGLTKKSSTGNETWDHSDGSQVLVHPYGDQKTGPHKSGNNAHIHKQDDAKNKLDDAGNISTDPNKTHIGTKNPKDLPAVRGRPHGS